MQIKTFSGSFYEIGKQQGKIFKNSKLKLKHKVDHKLLKKQIQIYKRFYPETMEEFNGMIDSSGLERNSLLYEIICSDIISFIDKYKLKKACTIFGIKNKNGFFVGRNYDWICQLQGLFEASKFSSPDRNSFVCVSDMGVDENNKQNVFYEPNDAINDKGLFIGLTYAHNKKWSYGLTTFHMIRLISETCSTVEEAVRTFKKVPLCVPKNFFIADKNGSMIAVEHTSKRFKIVYPEDNVLIQTNHYIDPELKKEDCVLKNYPAHNTFLRYYNTLQKINRIKNIFRSSDIIKVLSDKDVSQDHPRMKTIWSLALDMKKRKYKLYWNNKNEQILKI